MSCSGLKSLVQVITVTIDGEPVVARCLKKQKTARFRPVNFCQFRLQRWMTSPGWRTVYVVHVNLMSWHSFTWPSAGRGSLTFKQVSVDGSLSEIELCKIFSCITNITGNLSIQPVFISSYLEAKVQYCSYKRRWVRDCCLQCLSKWAAAASSIWFLFVSLYKR